MDETLHIESLANGDDAISHTADGKTVFVSGGCPGDTVSVILDEDKAGFARAHVNEIIEPSPQRVEAHCPNAALCGGCPWQHISYDTQLEAKRANVVDCLVRIGKLDRGAVEGLTAPVIASPKQWNQRNKVEFDVAQDRDGLRLGLHARKGALIAIDSCPLLPKALVKAPGKLQGALRFAQGSDDFGLTRLTLRSSVRTGDTEIALWTPPAHFPRAHVSKVLESCVKDAGLVRVMCKGDNKKREISGVEVLAGRGYWREQLGDFDYALSAPSFFQVNTAAAELLVQCVIEALAPDENMSIFDLYSGAGTFTLPLAASGADVIAVESYGSSVRDLRRNLETNELYADVIGGAVEYELAGMGSCDAAVIDPPRSGLHPDVVKALCENPPEKLVYVSCDPATLARDLKEFVKVFEVQGISPVDLFPQTSHVETVVSMSRKSS